MTEEIIRMAREAGMLTLLDEFSYRMAQEGRPPVLERFQEFAALVAAAEREECAKVALAYDQHAIAPAAIAAAIRARGQA